MQNPLFRKNLPIMYVNRTLNRQIKRRLTYNRLGNSVYFFNWIKNNHQQGRLFLYTKYLFFMSLKILVLALFNRSFFYFLRNFFQDNRPFLMFVYCSMDILVFNRTFYVCLFDINEYARKLIGSKPTLKKNKTFVSNNILFFFQINNFFIFSHFIIFINFNNFETRIYTIS